MSDDTTLTRRSALSAVGGGLAGVTGLAGVASAADSDAPGSIIKCLRYDVKTYQTCPPGSYPEGPVISAGAKAYPVCTDYNGEVLAYLVLDNSYDLSVEEAREAVSSDAIGRYGYVLPSSVTDC